MAFDQIGSKIKVLDYCAGTGFFSQALAPHVREIVGLDSLRSRTIEYNQIADQTKDDHPRCEMQAVCGDLIEGERARR